MLIVAIAVVYFSLKPKPERDPFISKVVSSRGGYDSHLDFLEMHGFITEEERQRDRDAIRHFKEHPEQYKITTLSELMDEFEKETQPKLAADEKEGLVNIEKPDWFKAANDRLHRIQRLTEALKIAESRLKYAAELDSVTKDDHEFLMDGARIAREALESEGT